LLEMKKVLEQVCDLIDFEELKLLLLGKQMIF
jgi:hypothetical protein